MRKAMCIVLRTMCLSFGAQVAGSQGITFDTADVRLIFAVGNSISYRTDTLTTSLDIGTPGQSSWDFSNLNTTSIMNLESMPVASTAYALDFPQATHALRDTGFTYSFYYETLGSITLKGTGFVYYTLNDNLLNYGLKGAGTAFFGGGGFPAQGQWVNTPASMDYSLPLQFSKTWTSDYTESVSGSAKISTFVLAFGPNDTRHSITYTVDAYGGLTLPRTQEVQALRIRKSDRYSSGSASGLRVGYIFLAKNGATVQMTLADPSATSGSVSVNSVQWKKGTLEVPVPIELASFTATRWQEESVRLEWTTLSETDNFGFYIQRKAPGEESFKDLPGSFVPGHGTTILPQKYSYLDIPAGSAEWWYRLRQVDLDGTVHLSEPAQVRVVTSVQGILPTSYELAQNYPNPFNPSTVIRYGLPYRSQVTLIVYNTLGQQVAVLAPGDQEAGYHEMKFDGIGLSGGVYFYRIEVRPTGYAVGRDSRSEAQDFVATRKMLIVK